MKKKSAVMNCSMEDQIKSSKFNLEGKTALITGGGGLLGPEHGIGLARFGASIVLIDIDEDGLHKATERMHGTLDDAVVKNFVVDITDESAINHLNNQLKDEGSQIDILINNAALNPMMCASENETFGTVENYDMNLWKRELNVGITGTFSCCKIFGNEMAKRGNGAIVNIASDLAIQAPDQRVYSSTGEMENVKHFKPIGYSVVKSAMLGLNRYLATYWAHRGVRVNCLIPGAVLNTQPDSLIEQIETRIPLQRLADKTEYQEAIAFLSSDASAYMTGQVLVMDGGRSVW